MSMINYASREVNCKIVYYGTGLGGKTTNLEYIYSRVNPDTTGKMISLATETDRTISFDFLPIDLGEVRGFKTRFQYVHGARSGVLQRESSAHHPEGCRRSGVRGRFSGLSGGGEHRVHA